MDEWLEELDRCKDRGWYFEIEPEESGRLADDIRKVLARADKMEAALRKITKTAPFGEPQEIARTALGDQQ
jgi:hypothetical protein